MARVRFVVDNTDGKNSIKSLKLKLKRKVYTFFYSAESGVEHQKKMHTSTIVSSLKLVGGKKGTTDDKTIELSVPNIDKVEWSKDRNEKNEQCYARANSYTARQMKDQVQRQIFNAVTPSCETKCFKVEYSLRAFVKYNGMGKTGQGEEIVMPIRIYQRPYPVLMTNPKYPEDWNP